MNRALAKRTNEPARCATLPLMPATLNPPAGPLTGIRVLDFSSFIAGCYAAQMLAEMGADVIKIEPLTGDLARAWAPFIAGEARYYMAWNRGKRGIAADLTSAPGREVAYRLARTADVLIENYRNGVTRKLKIDYDTIRAIQPNIVYCTTTAFGARGPQANRPGYDPVLQTLGGAAKLNERFNGGITAISAVAVSDFQAAMITTSSVCAALYHRERTGVGQHIETSLLQAIMTLQPHFFLEAIDMPEEGGTGIYPYRFYDTKDGMIFIAAGTDKFWRTFCAVLGLPDLAANPSYATNTQRVQTAETLTPIIQARFREQTTAHWERELLAAGVPHGGPRTPLEFFQDDQVTAMGMNPVIDHATAGRLRVTGLAADFSATPGAIQRPAPRLGEHTDEIMLELGYERTEIADLRARGVVR